MTEFDPKYHEAEERFRAEAVALHRRNEEIQAGIRRQVDLTQEEREASYMQAYEALNEKFEHLANTHIGTVENEKRELERKVHRETGAKFAEHLTTLANVPDEKLPELMKTARRTGQTDLEQAVAETALDRNRFGVFEDWARESPEKGEALKSLRSYPETERLVTRTTTLRPFKATTVGLSPTREDLDREARKTSAGQASQEAFFNRPRRQVGSRVE